MPVAEKLTPDFARKHFRHQRRHRVAEHPLDVGPATFKDETIRECLEAANLLARELSVAPMKWTNGRARLGLNLAAPLAVAVRAGGGTHTGCYPVDPSSRREVPGTASYFSFGSSPRGFCFRSSALRSALNSLRPAVASSAALSSLGITFPSRVYRAGPGLSGAFRSDSKLKE